ncbi:hypothetical protein QBC36DRAFT_369258 [Triangularia setosa]|uniref:Uncharacterized protein n=1 Tax=Triangularia setosa TaxID=2587417 RepID=A0AAN6WA45_9PEZI|nr:hypothetical protein QBC36DRAFT_369258 [Podospora setosa]
MESKLVLMLRRGVVQGTNECCWGGASRGRIVCSAWMGKWVRSMDEMNRCRPRSAAAALVVVVVVVVVELSTRLIHPTADAASCSPNNTQRGPQQAALPGQFDHVGSIEPIVQLQRQSQQRYLHCMQCSAGSWLAGLFLVQPHQPQEARAREQHGSSTQIFPSRIASPNHHFTPPGGQSAYGGGCMGGGKRKRDRTPWRYDLGRAEPIARRSEKAGPRPVQQMRGSGAELSVPSVERCAGWVSSMVGGVRIENDEVVSNNNCKAGHSLAKSNTETDKGRKTIQQTI